MGFFKTPPYPPKIMPIPKKVKIALLVLVFLGFLLTVLKNA